MRPEAGLPVFGSGVHRLECFGVTMTPKEV